MKKKRCYKCKETKPITEFGKHRGRPDGLRAECRKCTRALAVESHAKNKDHLAAFRRKYFIQSGHDQDSRHDIRGLIKRDYPQDGYCEICHSNNKRLAYHHWNDSFPSWGIWMCAGCHLGSNFLEKTELTKKYTELRESIEKNYNPDVSQAPLTMSELKQWDKEKKK